VAVVALAVTELAQELLVAELVQSHLYCYHLALITQLLSELVGQARAALEMATQEVTQFSTRLLPQAEALALLDSITHRMVALVVLAVVQVARLQVAALVALGLLIRVLLVVMDLQQELLHRAAAAAVLVR
jgi:hypothetical protein